MGVARPPGAAVGPKIRYEAKKGNTIFFAGIEMFLLAPTAGDGKAVCNLTVPQTFAPESADRRGGFPDPVIIWKNFAIWLL
jgi:hypothetical protein